MFVYDKTLRGVKQRVGLRDDYAGCRLLPVSRGRKPAQLQPFRHPSSDDWHNQEIVKKRHPVSGTVLSVEFTIHS